MFLTRAFLNPRRRGAQRLLTNPQGLHAAVLAGFPNQPVVTRDSGGPRVLWRVDTDNPYRLVLWLASPDRPDLTHLVEQAGWCEAAEPQWQVRSYEPLLDGLRKGQRYAFRLSANPTRSIRVADGASRTKRVEHVTAEHQVRWLVERADANGFQVLTSTALLPGSDEQALDLKLLQREKVGFRRGSGTGRVTVSRVWYEGALEVTEPRALRGSLVGGIGRARAYGCGLLTLAPLHNRG